MNNSSEVIKELGTKLNELPLDSLLVLSRLITDFNILNLSAEDLLTVKKTLNILE